ncbi:MAG TPA: PilZ domain-containing protein [Methylomirabilota bacterium]|nr:PilZ domain-containing protein [Methylomirabilota bacterium]
MIREREPDLRRHPRARVSWPVTVEVGDRIFYLETVNLSPFGAKLRLEDASLEPGTPVQLHFRPPDGRPLDVQAIVWRTDPDGPAFFFIGVDRQDFTFPTDGSDATDASQTAPPQR